MKFLSRRVLPAALLVALAVPASAAAASPAAPVKSAAKRSQVAVTQLRTAIAKHNDALALKSLARSRREAAAASRKARGLAAGALAGRRDTQVAAGALKSVATTYDANLESYAALIPGASDAVAAALAAALTPSINGREAAVNLLTQLLGNASGDSQAGLAELVSALSGNATDDPAAIAGALTAGSLPTNIADIVSGAMATATACVEAALVRLDGLLGVLPPAAAGIVTETLTMISGTLNGIAGLIDQVIGTVTSQTPGAGSLPGLDQLAGVGSILDMVLSGIVKPILGSVTSLIPTNLIPPIVGGGSGSGTGTGGSSGGGFLGLPGLDILSGILGGLFSSRP